MVLDLTKKIEEKKWRQKGSLLLKIFRFFFRKKEPGKVIELD